MVLSVQAPLSVLMRDLAMQVRFPQTRDGAAMQHARPRLYHRCAALKWLSLDDFLPEECAQFWAMPEQPTAICGTCTKNNNPKALTWVGPYHHT